MGEHERTLECRLKFFKTILQEESLEYDMNNPHLQARTKEGKDLNGMKVLARAHGEVSQR